jgi:hypothetical protein
VPFFDVERERLWIFWRRVLHTAHHRTQLTVYLRLLDRPFPPCMADSRCQLEWSRSDELGGGVIASMIEQVRRFARLRRANPRTC